VRGARDARRVVVTGQGVVTPVGTGVANFWRAIRKGECGVGPVTAFPLTEQIYITIAGEVKDFDARKNLSSKPLLLADRYSQFAATAAED